MEERTRTLLVRAVTTVLLLVAVVLLVVRSRPVSTPTAIAVAGLAPFALIPATLAVGVAALGRRVVLGGVAVAVLAATLVVIAPHDAIFGCRGEAVEESITILTANVKDGGAAADDIAALVADRNPDIVVLQETSAEVLAFLEADARLDPYSHRSNAEPWAPVSILTWSRWPVTLVEMEPFSGVRLVHTEIDTPFGTMTLSNVHTTSPSQAALAAQWQRQFEQLQSIETATPRIMAGDFNATEDHKAFRDLLDRGWSDAHDDRGCGFDATWPADAPLAIYRLDHVLVTDHFVVDALDVGRLEGSDHKPVIASVRFSS